MNDRRKELQGPITGHWEVTKFCPFETPIYGESKIWWIQNVGSQRAEWIEWLKQNNIEIIEEYSIFKWIEIALFTEEEEKLITDKFKQIMAEKYI